MSGLTLPGQKKEKPETIVPTPIPTPLPTTPTFVTPLITPELPRTTVSVIETIKPFSETYKNLTLGDRVIDSKIGEVIDGRYEGGFEEGLNIVFGPTGAGKSTLCLQLAMRGLENDWNVKYFDIESSIRKPRILQMYEAMGKSFPMERLNNVFFRLKTWSFDELFDIWISNIEVEKPDLFIVDAFSPIFLDSFLSPDLIKGKSDTKIDRWKLLRKRYTLATRTQKLCVENHVIAVVVGHERPPYKDETKKENIPDEIVREAEEFTGLGGQFAFQGKTWFYLGFTEGGGRVMALLKHRFIPAPLRVDKIPPEKLIYFKITDKGIGAI